MIEKAYIIDDDDISIFVTSVLLETENFAREIECFLYAEAALEKLLRHDELLPQVIFLDLNMPVVSGWDFLEAMTGQQARFLNKCHVYILTSSVDPQEIELARKYSLVKGFLRKPLDEEEIRKIKQCLKPGMADL